MSNWVCPVHGGARWVKPGVSKKTGQPYTGFFCCTEKGCEERPPRETPNTKVPVQGFHPQETGGGSYQRQPQKAAPDWDKIAEGKCRSLVLCAWIQSNRPMSEFWEYELGFIAYMMSGKSPTMDERWEDIPPPQDAPF